MQRNEKRLSVLLTKTQWEQLRVSEYKLFVRAAFYLGLPIEYIRTRVESDGYEADRLATIESAVELGLSDEDKVYLITGFR